MRKNRKETPTYLHDSWEYVGSEPRFFCSPVFEIALFCTVPGVRGYNRVPVWRRRWGMSPFCLEAPMGTCLEAPMRAHTWRHNALKYMCTLCIMYLMGLHNAAPVGGNILKRYSTALTLPGVKLWSFLISACARFRRVGEIYKTKPALPINLSHLLAFLHEYKFSQ
jgi:hypothetical protein